MKNNNILFTDKDKKNYKSHEKGYYPPEKEYKTKSKITKGDP